MLDTATFQSPTTDATADNEATATYHYPILSMCCTHFRFDLHYEKQFTVSRLVHLILCLNPLQLKQTYSNINPETIITITISSSFSLKFNLLLLLEYKISLL